MKEKLATLYIIVDICYEKFDEKEGNHCQIVYLFWSAHAIWATDTQNNNISYETIVVQNFVLFRLDYTVLYARREVLIYLYIRRL